MRRLIAALLCGAACFAASPAAAQGTEKMNPATEKTTPGVVSALSASETTPEVVFSQAAPRRAPTAHIGIHVFGALDREAVSASKSFNAVFGKSSLTGFGVGADVLNVWRGAFVRVSFSHMSASGNRAIVSGSQVISLGVPLKMAMTPIEVGAGWRFRSPRQVQTLTPYAGGGLLALKYSETSDFANAGDNTQTTFNGVFVFGGVDFLVMKILSIGAEVDFRSAPNSAGAGGLSQSYGETNLGGTAIRVLFGIRK